MQPISFLTKTKIVRRALLAAILGGVAALVGTAHADATAGTYKTPALIRQGRDLIQKETVLTDLLSATAFQGKFFTVIDGEGTTPIAFNSDPDLCLKAATAYNAFTESRNYFLKVLGPIVTNLPPAQQDYLNQPMVIRLNMTHLFSAEIHFDQVDTTSNGAVTIPASDEFRLDNIPAWGVETWFFVAKNEKTPNAAAQIPAILNNTDFKISIFDSLAQNDAVTAIQNVQVGTYSTTVLAENLLVSLGLAEGLTPIMAKAISIIPGHVYLDAVMIPEIGANEYAHYALYPWLGLKRRFPVGEGYAHYFASKITGLVKLQDTSLLRIHDLGRKYSKGYQAITGASKGVYGFANEVGPTAASSSFTFSLLDDLEKSLGTNGLPVIVGTIPLLNDSSNLRIDFSQSVMASITQLDQAQAKNSTADILQAQKVLTLRGM